MAKKSPSDKGSAKNSNTGSATPRAQFDRAQAGEHVPYYPEFTALDSCFSIGINQRNYLGEKPGGAHPEKRKDDAATPRNLRALG